MGKVILVTGGARSGKSTYAEQRAQQSGRRVLYIATAIALDAEMRERITKHKQRRPVEWDTFEGYRHLNQVVAAAHPGHDAILLDCVTVMLSNLLWDELGDAVEQAAAEELERLEQQITAEVRDFIDAALAGTATVIIVTNEIGFGIVPESKLSRVFRDLAGRVNQYIASRADEAVLVVCGLPLQLK